MQLVGDKAQLWICTVLLVSLHLWGSFSASTPPPSPPAPTLDIYSRSSDSVVLVCRAPEGHSGLYFTLYKVREKVDSREQPLGAGELDHHQDAAPTHSVPSYLHPPILSVEPSNGSVKRGEMFSLRCSLPPSLPKYQSTSYNRPVSFMLLRDAAPQIKGMTSIIPQPLSSQVSIPEPQPGVFSVGPVTGAEQGQYSCIYQISRTGRLVNSSVSNVVQVTVMDLLPTPTLLLQQQSDVWHLLCKGSPAYPGALFSLFLVDHALPVTTYHAKVTQYQAVFPVPVQDTAVAMYQCEYSVLLGRDWSNSGRSPALLVLRGNSSTPSTDSSGVDWPLVVGSLSAIILFLCAVTLIIVVLHRKVRAAAEAKKKREEAQFWTQIHGKDHVVDLTLRRASFTSQDWTSRHSEAVSRSQLWYPLSTFTTPIIPNN